MFETIKQALQHTPVWVYILFVFLLWRMIQALKAQFMSLNTLWILPAVFTFLSIETIFMKFPITASLIFTWLLAIVVGSAIGYILVFRHQITVDKQKKLLLLPGSVQPLILMLIIFASKYYIEYSVGESPELTQSASFALQAAIISGISAGLFVGRFINYVQRFMKGPFGDLNTDKK